MPAFSPALSNEDGNWYNNVDEEEARDAAKALADFNAAEREKQKNEQQRKAQAAVDRQILFNEQQRTQQRIQQRTQQRIQQSKNPTKRRPIENQISKNRKSRRKKAKNNRHEKKQAELKERRNGEIEMSITP